MASKPLRAGDTFWIRSDLEVEESHLHFALTSPSEATQAVWIVNMTSTAYDSTVVMEPGDHPAVKHRSYIWYKEATKVSSGALEEALQSGVAVADQRASQELLKVLREGFLKSGGVERASKTEFAMALLREQGRKTTHPRSKPDESIRRDRKSLAKDDKQP